MKTCSILSTCPFRSFLGPTFRSKHSSSYYAPLAFSISFAICPSILFYNNMYFFIARNSALHSAFSIHKRYSAFVSCLLLVLEISSLTPSWSSLWWLWLIFASSGLFACSGKCCYVKLRFRKGWVKSFMEKQSSWRIWSCQWFRKFLLAFCPFSVSWGTNQRSTFSRLIKWLMFWVTFLRLFYLFYWFQNPTVFPWFFSCLAFQLTWC